MNVPESPYVLELPNVLHLATDVTAVAHEEASSLRLAAALHPVPPRSAARRPIRARAAIAELEGLDRGRVLRVRSVGSTPTVTASGRSRCAADVVDASDPIRIELFAGCGIVEGSDPAEELAETKAKLVPMVDALLG